MLSSVHHHIRHHGRFYIAALLGVGAWAVAHAMLSPLRLVIAGNTFFGSYLTLTAIFARKMTPQQIRERARYEDEGMFVIILLIGVAIVLSIASIFSIMGEKTPTLLNYVLSGANVLLGWLSLHTIMAFRYAHVFYARQPGPGQQPEKGGLEFPGTSEPKIWDFLYYSFVVAMTAQVSDVDVLTSRMRRLTLLHGIASFFFNTVLLALAVNIAAGQVR